MKVITSPAKYLQAKGVFENLQTYVSALGKCAYSVVDPFILDNYGEKLKSSFANTNTAMHMEKFRGECSRAEIDRLIGELKNKGVDVIIGVGGGKTLDTAKAVAYFTELPVIIMPTAASSDAPCSALSVLYTEKGEFSEYLFLKANPNAVLVDIGVTAAAPVRFTVSGMGDALATYYEARACHRSGAKSMAGGKCSISALNLATACRDTLFADGFLAKLACEQKTVSQAVDNIIEANIFLSGIGFESGGLGAAHAIHNGLTVLEECHHMLHGEKVAFGTLVQLVLENALGAELQEVLSFCKKVGLPTCLAQLGVTTIEPEKILAVAKASCAEGETIHNMPFAVTPEDVFSAILVADKLGSI